MAQYLRLLYHFGMMSLLMQMAYPPSFVLAIIAKSLRVVLLLVFFQAVYLHTTLLAGWDRHSILALVATYLTLEFALLVTIHRNLLYYLPERIRSATFDYVLTKPVSPLFYASLRVIDFMDLISFLPVAVLWIVVLRGMQVTAGMAGTYLALLIVSFTLLCALVIIVSSIAFWTFTGTGLGRLFENLMRLARYPGQIFRGAFGVLLLYVLPAVTSVTVPASVFRNALDWHMLWYLILYAAVACIAAALVWRASLRHYGSASA